MNHPVSILRLLIAMNAVKKIRLTFLLAGLVRRRWKNEGQY